MKAFQYTEIRQIVEDFGLRIPKLPVKMLVGRDDVRKIVRHEDLVMLEIDHPSSIVLKGGLYNGEEFFESVDEAPLTDPTAGLATVMRY